MKRSTMTITTLAAVLALTILASPAQAQLDWGIRGGIYSDDSDPFLGVELITPLTRQIRFNPNIEFMFGSHRDVFAVSADFLWIFPTTPDFEVWAGAGPTLLVIDDDRPLTDDDTNVGLNLLAGIGLRTTMAFLPYLQGKLIIADNSEGVIAIGARF